MSAIWAATSTGFDIETIKTAALGISGASLIIGLILMKVVSNVVGKVVSLVVFVAIALAGYSLRPQPSVQRRQKPNAIFLVKRSL